MIILLASRLTPHASDPYALTIMSDGNVHSYDDNRKSKYWVIFLQYPKYFERFKAGVTIDYGLQDFKEQLGRYLIFLLKKRYFYAKLVKVRSIWSLSWNRWHFQVDRIRSFYVIRSFCHGSAHAWSDQILFFLLYCLTNVFTARVIFQVGIIVGNSNTHLSTTYPPPMHHHSTTYVPPIHQLSTTYLPHPEYSWTGCFEN